MGQIRTRVFPIDPLHVPYECGAAESRRSVATWVVVCAVTVVCVVSFSLAAILVGPPSVAGHLTESPVADGSWLVQWGPTMQPPSVEQARELRALRLVAGGAATLVSILCLLIVAGLWRQRLLLRRSEYFVHWAVGARHLQMAARLLGEGRTWGGAIAVLSYFAAAITLWLIELTFPGEASVDPSVAVALIVLSGLGVVLIRWESRSGQASLRRSRGRPWQILSSPAAIGAVGFAVLCGVGLLALHAPYASSSRPRDEVVIGASLGDLPVESRGAVIASWEGRLRASGARLGLASAGAARATGHRDQIWVECGRCSEGGVPMPIKFLSAELHAVAPDTFAHLGMAVSRGRDFADELDRDAPGVAIVSRALANRHFERGEAVGRRVRVGDTEWLTVVGVVEDRDDARTPTDYAVYLPLALAAPSEIELLADVPPAGLASMLSTAPPGVALGIARSWAEVFAAHRWFRALLGALGIAAFGLLGAGLWVSSANESGAARHEVAVRRAVGAPRRVLWRFYVAFTGRRLFAALLVGGWLSLFLGAGLAEAYGSIPRFDGLVWSLAAAWVCVTHVLGSAPRFVRAARSPLISMLEEES